MKTVVGMFDDLSDAHEVVEDLMDAGFTRDDVSLVARDRASEYGTFLDEDVDDVDNEVAESTATGAVAGGAIGGLAGLLVGLGALTIPGIGPVVAAGPIVAALTGAGIGAAAGGIFGALVGWGIPETEAELYAEGVRRGAIIVAVRAPENRVERAVEIMADYDPVDIQRRSSYWREEGWARYDPNAEPLTADQIDQELSRYDRYSAQSDVDYGEYEEEEYGYDEGQYDTLEPSFRHHYETNYRTSDYAYNQHQPAYRYGYDLATDYHYRDRTWDEVEPEARRRWEEVNEGTWEEFKESIRHGWEELKRTLS
jgi:hypothetical protein